MTDCTGEWRYAGRVEDGPFIVWGNRCTGCGEFMVIIDCDDRSLGWHQKAVDDITADTFQDAVRAAMREVFTGPGV